MQKKDAAIRKRTQIAKANRTMFMWVAGISAIVGFALVGSIFLIQKITSNEEVLSEKSKTVIVLKANNANIPDLEAAIRVLDTNQALIDAKAKPADQAVQVILDALPSEANPLALGASLQNKLLANVPGLTIESLQVDPVAIVDDSATAVDATQSEITFRFAVSGSDQALKEVLTRLERSIRAIDITSLRIESQGSNRLLTIQARAFYQPARVVELKDKEV
jgi:outer membrane protein OmpA-like peptidoglycan-associated protein